MNDKYIFNFTFKSSSPNDLNACVGNNGSQTIEDYAEGYRKAPKILLDYIIDQDDIHEDLDVLVHPIAFCMRHAVELEIKDSILKLGKIRRNNNVRNYKISSSHNIGNMWKFFKIESLRTDRRYGCINERISPFIEDLCEIDPTGQTFRYSHDVNEEKHLKETPTINLMNLRDRFVALECLLIELSRLNGLLIEEYKQGTFTSCLSRKDLLDIANRLPDRWLWGDTETFIRCKQKIREDFDLSNNKFTEAVNIIESHYEFSCLIGVERPLKHTTLNDVVSYFDILEKRHPKRVGEASITIHAPPGIGHVISEMKLSDECVNEGVDSFSVETLADLATMYNLGRSNCYSEFYEHQVIYEKEMFQRCSQNESDYFVEVDHYLSKRNAKSAIFRALKKLGQKTIVDALSCKFPHLLEVRRAINAVSSPS